MNADSPPYSSYTNSYGKLTGIKPLRLRSSALQIMESPKCLGSATLGSNWTGHDGLDTERRFVDESVNAAAVRRYAGYSNNTGGGETTSYYVANKGLQKLQRPTNRYGVYKNGIIHQRMDNDDTDDEDDDYHAGYSNNTGGGGGGETTSYYVANKGLQKQQGLTNLNGVTSGVGNGVVAKHFMVLNWK